MPRRLLIGLVTAAGLAMLLPAAPAAADDPIRVGGDAILTVTSQTATSVTLRGTMTPAPSPLGPPTITRVDAACETDRAVLLTSSVTGSADIMTGLTVMVTGRVSGEALRCDARVYFQFMSADGKPQGWTDAKATIGSPTTSTYPPRVSLDSSTPTTATFTAERSRSDVVQGVSIELACESSTQGVESARSTTSFGVGLPITVVLTGLVPGATYTCTARSVTAGTPSAWRSVATLNVPGPSLKAPPAVTSARSSTHVQFTLTLKTPAGGWGVAKPTVVGAERECWLEGRWLPDRIDGDRVIMTGLVTSPRAGRALVNCYQLRLVLRTADGSTVKTDFATALAPMTTRDPYEAGMPKVRQGARGRVLLQATKYGGLIRARCWPVTTPNPQSPDELAAALPDVSGEAWDHETSDQRVFTLETAPNTAYRCGYWIVTDGLPDNASPVVDIRTGPAAGDWSIAGFTAANGVINVDIAAVRGSSSLPDTVSVTCARSGRADVAATGSIPGAGGRVTISVPRLDPSGSYTCTAAARWSTYTMDAVPVSRQPITPAPSRTDTLTLTPIPRGRLQAALWPADGDRWRVACWPAANQSGDVDRLGALPRGAMTSAPTTERSIRIDTDPGTTYRCGAWKTSGDDDYRDTALITVATSPLASGLTITDISSDGNLAVRFTSDRTADNLPTEVKVTCPGRNGASDKWSIPVAGRTDTVEFPDLFYTRNPYLTYNCTITQFVGTTQASRQTMTLAPTPEPIVFTYGPTFVRNTDSSISIRRWTLTSWGRHSSSGLVTDAECSVMTNGRQDTVTARSWTPLSENYGLAFSWGGMATAFPYDRYRCRARVIDTSLPVSSKGYAGTWGDWSEVSAVSGRPVLVEDAEITIAPGAVKGARITVQDPNAKGETYVDHLGQAICTPTTGTVIDTGWVPMTRVLDQYTFNGYPYTERFPSFKKERLAIDVPGLVAGTAYTCQVRLTRPRGYSTTVANPAFAGAWAAVDTFTRQKPGASASWTKVVNALGKPISYGGGGYGWWVNFPRTPGVPRMRHQIQCRATSSDPWTDGYERMGTGGELGRAPAGQYTVELVHQTVFGKGTWECRARAYFSGVDIAADPLAASDWASSGPLTYS